MRLPQYLCRWLVSLALLLPWLSFVAANPPAHALEKVTLFFAYRNAVIAFGEKQKYLFPRLAAKVQSSSGADFKEFLNHVTDKTYTESDLKSAGVDLSDPDPEKATKMLLATGGTKQVNAELIQGKPTLKYWDQIASVEKVMELCTYESSWLAWCN